MSANIVNRQDFKASACIDWLDVTIHTMRGTQQRYIKAALDVITGGNHYINPQDKQEDTGQNATVFAIRFHDELANDALALMVVINELRQEFPFSEEPTISGIEVACDFRFKGPSQELERKTLAMTHRLQTSLFAPGAAKPRQYDPSIKDNRYLGGRNDEGTRIDPSLNFRIGNRHDDVSWQVYFKITDHNKQPIGDQSRWCARAEVTCQGPTLHELGLVGLSDLRGYDFQKLMPLFRFRIPVDPLTQAKGNLIVQTAILANRRINDATPQRGMHTFNELGRRDKRRRLRAQSSHIETDEQLQDAVKGALKRLAA